MTHTVRIGQPGNVVRVRQSTGEVGVRTGGAIIRTRTGGAQVTVRSGGVIVRIRLSGPRGPQGDPGPAQIYDQALAPIPIQGYTLLWFKSGVSADPNDRELNLVVSP